MPPPPPPGPGQATKAGHATSVVFSASDMWQLILPTLPHQEEEEGRSEDRAAVWDAYSWRAAVHRLLRGSCPTGADSRSLPLTRDWRSDALRVGDPARNASRPRNLQPIFYYPRLGSEMCLSRQLFVSGSVPLSIYRAGPRTGSARRPTGRRSLPTWIRCTNSSGCATLALRLGFRVSSFPAQDTF